MGKVSWEAFSRNISSTTSSPSSLRWSKCRKPQKWFKKSLHQHCLSQRSGNLSLFVVCVFVCVCVCVCVCECVCLVVSLCMWNEWNCRLSACLCWPQCGTVFTLVGVWICVAVVTAAFSKMSIRCLCSVVLLGSKDSHRSAEIISATKSKKKVDWCNNSNIL